MKKAKQTRAARKYALPDFELAPLSTIDPQKLFKGKTGTRVERFFLALAVAFNDLRDNFFFMYLVTQWLKAAPSEPTPELGMVAGLHVFTTRMTTGVIFEILELIKKETAVFAHPEFQAVLARLSKLGKDKWATLVDFANEHPRAKHGKSESLKGALHQLRNCASYHYYGTANFETGFRRHFSGAKTPFNAVAYYADGDSAEGTRFHFADAAVDAFAATHGDGDGGGRWFADTVGKVALQVNEIIKPILVVYLEERKAGR